jgi:hypothetical protein
MRANLALSAALVGLFGFSVSGSAQQITTAATNGGGRTGPAGNFVSGFTPGKIVNRPIDIGGATRPMNFQSTMMPRPQSNKVFNINSAFSKVRMPLFQSHVPSVPVVQPGPGNPIQPVSLPKVKQATPTPQTRWLGVLPGWGG